MSGVANLWLDKVLSTCSGDAPRQDVPQKTLDMLSSISNYKSSFQGYQADVVASKLLSNFGSPIKSIEKRTREQKLSRHPHLTKNIWKKTTEKIKKNA